MTTQDQEIATALEAIRSRVLARRAALGASEEQSLSEMQAALQDVNAHARVNSHLPLLWEDMVVGRLRSLVQRLVRRLLRWYINPIVDQQNVYNAASANALTLLSAENARLRSDLARLAERVSELEKRQRNE